MRRSRWRTAKRCERSSCSPLGAPTLDIQPGPSIGGRRHTLASSSYLKARFASIVNTTETRAIGRSQSCDGSARSRPPCGGGQGVGGRAAVSEEGVETQLSRSGATPLLHPPPQGGRISPSPDCPTTETPSRRRPGVIDDERPRKSDPPAHVWSRHAHSAAP